MAHVGRFLLGFLLGLSACDRGLPEGRKDAAVLGAMLPVPAALAEDEGPSGPAQAEESPAAPPPGPPEAPRERFPALSCYERARSETMLAQPDAYQLCYGAANSEPVTCYERASAAFLLSVQAIELCRCAESQAPVDCYLRARTATFLGQAEIIGLCSATAMGRLYPNCAPIR